jgi:DNA-binding beta-propeller fold protein YncE
VSSRCVVTPAGRPAEPASDVLVTHITQADSPLNSATNQRGYLVKLRSEEMTVARESFTDLGLGASHAVAVGSRWNYVSGRYVNPLGPLLRMVDGTGGVRVDSTVMNPSLESVFRVAEARGVALSADEKRLYVIGRSPDVLLVASLEGAAGDGPAVRVVHGTPLPEAPNELAVLSRPGRGDLLAITCTNAGVVALYDDDVGDVVAQVPGVGVQPFGLAVDRRGKGARLFATNFQDGRVAVIDVPDLEQPQGARLVAHLGRQQLCLIRPTDAACQSDGGVP